MNAETVDPYAVILSPLSSEKAIQHIEFSNSLTFVVNPRATKSDVRTAVEKIFNVKVTKVNLHNSIQGQKRAFVKLHADSIAADISADMGLI